jgi:hypothetical protein
MNLIREITPCSQGVSCRNSVENVGVALSKCGSCRLAPFQEHYEQQFWSGIRGAKHPTLEQEKLEKHRAASQEKQLKRKSRDRSKVALLKKAVKAEKITEENLIKSTVNSGRKFKDGDHIVAGSITLDTKLQSNRIHPKVDLDELHKVTEDSKRAGTFLGALMIRTCNNVGVVVMTEEDFARLMDQWRRNAGPE